MASDFGTNEVRGVSKWRKVRFWGVRTPMARNPEEEVLANRRREEEALTKRKRARRAAGLAIATIGALAFWWSSLWVVFVIACSLVFPIIDRYTVLKSQDIWSLPVPPKRPFAELEYQEASEDWRHRDRLTWQLPTVLVSLVGLVMSQLYKQQPFDPKWIKVAILVMLASMSGLLVVTLKQNLLLQHNNRAIMESISRAEDFETGRFGFSIVGSNSFYRLTWLVWILLAVGATVECFRLALPDCFRLILVTLGLN